MDEDFTQHFKNKANKYKDWLGLQSVTLSTMSYDSRCMFLLALYGFIEASFMVDENIQSGQSFSTEEILDYVRRWHSRFIEDIEDIFDTVTLIKSDCLSDECLSKVNKIIEHDRLRRVLSRLWIYPPVKNPDLMDTFLKMSGEV